VTPYRLADTYQYFTRTCDAHHRDHPDDWGKRFLCNISAYVSAYAPYTHEDPIIFWSLCNSRNTTAMRNISVSRLFTFNGKQICDRMTKKELSCKFDTESEKKLKLFQYKSFKINHFYASLFRIKNSWMSIKFLISTLTKVDTHVT
jgi:hypothetical protein